MNSRSNSCGWPRVGMVPTDLASGGAGPGGTTWLAWRRRLEAFEAARVRDLLALADEAGRARVWARAECAARDAVQLAPRDPACHQALGNVFLAAGRPEDALSAYERAQALAPGVPEILNNLGTAWQALADWRRAAACFTAALRAAPELAAAHVNLGILRLSQGRYRAGWSHYEWRLRLQAGPSRTGPGARPARALHRPRRLVLDAEQGLGDTLQMARLVRHLSCRGFDVVLRCQAALVPLLRHARLAADVRALETAAPEAGAGTPLLSLPRLLNVRPDAIPGGVPYVAAEPRRVARWRQELALLQGLRVGVVWQGNPSTPSDAARSIPLAAFAPLALPGVSLISLQHGIGLEQLADPSASAVPLVNLGRTVDADGAFLDTAAILRNLDLLITCDTAAAHLAGAMGVPVWLALSVSPHWTWLLDREDSPWYPSARLFRQPRRGDWAAVFARMARELAALVRPAGLALESGDTTTRAEPPAISLVRAEGGWMLAPAADVYVGRSLLRHGEYSEEEAERLCAYLQPGDVAVDVGAHVGALTVALARRVGVAGAVFAFEPQGTLCRLLEANLALNGLANVTCLEAAAGARAGRLRLPALDYSREGNFGGVALGGGSGPCVRVRRIDSLRLRACRLIKIDVEGMEGEVVRGAAATIARHRPILYVEADRAESTPALVRRLRKAGYRLYLHLPPLVRPQNGGGASPGAALVSVNLLCLPEREPCTPGDLPAIDGREDWAALLERVQREPLPHAAPAARGAPRLLAPVTPAELLDRITVLELKAARLPEAAQRAGAEAQRAEMEAVSRSLAPLPEEAARALTALRKVNAALWEAENAVRQHEVDGRFDASFVARARSIARLNDERALLKTRLNAVCGALFNDDKSYARRPDARGSPLGG